MKILIATITVIIISTIAVSNTPNKGDNLCWFSSVKDVSCGTYGWSKRKDLAMKASKGKCEDYCEAKCELDYCEMVK